MTPQGKANSDTRYSEIFELWDLNADIHESTGQELEFQREENLAERNPELPDGGTSIPIIPMKP